MTETTPGRRMLVALAEHLIEPPEPEPAAETPQIPSIVEMVNVKRDALQEVEDHRRMVELLTSTNHRQRAIACIVDKMTYMELLDFTEDVFGEQGVAINAASFPAHIARWARKARS